MATRRGLGVGLGSGYYNLNRLDPYIHSLSRRGISTYKNKIKTLYQAKELVFPDGFPAPTPVVYHKGIFQNKGGRNHPLQDKKETENQLKHIDATKDEIRRLLFDVLTYGGEKATKHKILEIVLLKDKEKHLNYLTAHTDWGAVGYFKDDKLKTKFDEENNVIVQVEYLDTPSGKVSKRLLELFDAINKAEVGESALYVRAEPVSDSSLNLREWRVDKTDKGDKTIVINGNEFAPEK